MHMRKQLTLVISAILLGGICVLVTDAQTKRRPRGKAKPKVATQIVPLGLWGGADIQLTVKEAAADIQFSCAAGSIPGRLRYATNGSFRVPGSYTAGSHGPVSQTGGPKPQAVTYFGKIAGDKMTLTIDFPGQKEPDLSFSLERGKMDDRFVRCY
jgi:hypothetical protein